MSPVWAPFVLSSQRSFCLGACRQLLHRADAGIQASRRRIVESDPQESWGTRLHVYVPYGTSSSC